MIACNIHVEKNGTNVLFLGIYFYMYGILGIDNVLVGSAG